MKCGATSVVLGVAFAAGCSKEPSGSTDQTIPHAGSVTITSLVAERSGDHLHLTVTALVKNPGPGPLTLAPPAAQLWIGKDKPAAPFIAAGLAPAVVASGAESEAATHWWLAAVDLRGSLEMEIAGAKLVVKEAGDFSVNSLAEGEAAALHWPNWRASSSR